MAVRPGEENVATLFGDIHYFYGPPTAHPPHHRFDKGSYVYLFENASERRARIEIANQPGTEQQDAFDGFLDKVHVTYSYRQQCAVNLVVGDVEGHEQWHLPTFDPRNENKYHYKLHSLDIYFWTQDDALSFLNGIRRVLPPNQVDVQDEPAPPQQQQQQQQQKLQQPHYSQQHSVDPSSVVQQLEKVAIGDSHINIPPPPPQTTSASNSDLPSFAPPPISTGAHDSESPNSAASPASFVPMAYNPAAPAAPEQIVHREKTPPPEDGDLNPLHARLLQDAGTPFSPGLVNGMPSGLGPLSPGMPPPQFQPPPGAPSFPGPPVGTPGIAPQGFGIHAQAHAQAQHPGLVRAVTMPITGAGQGLPSPALASPYGTQPYPVSPAPPYTPMQPSHQQAQIQQPLPQPQHQPTPPITSPGLPPPPPGGFSNYSYASQHGGGHTAGDPYAIHQIAYRPTEGEVAVKYAPKKEVRGRLEENAGRIEKSVTGMLKRFEKKFG